MTRGGQWLQQLPIVLLGVRAIPDDQGVSPFTTVTGTSLLVPNVNSSRVTDSSFIKQLARSMREIDFARLSEGKVNSPRSQYIPHGLRSSSHLWVRVDRVRRALEAPYRGPYEVQRWNDKVVTIKKEDGSLETVSIDRVKSAIQSSANSAPSTHSSTPASTQSSTLDPQPSTQPST